MAVPSPAKAMLRQELTARRRAFAAGPDAVAANSAIAKRVLETAPLGHVVAVYQLLADEVDPASLIALLLARGHAIALPRVEGRAMRFHRWHPGTPLIPGPLGLQQPPADAPVTSPDTIIAPLLGFDRAGNRIGYGAGYYDRAFAQFASAHRIGIAWACQECVAIPADAWDVPLHAIATQTEWITP